MVDVWVPLGPTDATVCQPAATNVVRDADVVQAAVVDSGATAHDVGVVKPHMMLTMVHGDVEPITGKGPAKVVVPVSLSSHCSVAAAAHVLKAACVVGFGLGELAGAGDVSNTTKFDSDPEK